MLCTVVSRGALVSLCLGGDTKWYVQPFNHRLPAPSSWILFGTIAANRVIFRQVFSAVGYTNTTTGNVLRPAKVCGPPQGPWLPVRVAKRAPGLTPPGLTPSGAGGACANRRSPGLPRLHGAGRCLHSFCSVHPAPTAPDTLAPSWSQLSDRSDAVAYALRNAPLIALAGVITGFQEAYYKFEVRERARGPHACMLGTAPW